MFSNSANRILGIFIFFAAFWVNAQSLKLGHGNAVGHPLDIASHEFAKVLAEKTQGKLTTKVYPATQLGSESQMIAAVRGGVQDIVITSTAPVATIIDEYLLFDLPFLLQSNQEADAILDGKIGADLLAKANSKNMIGLCYWENGFRQITNNKHPIKNMADLAGLDEAYKTFFPAGTPARRVVGVGAIAQDALVQIDVTVANEEGTPPIL